MREVLIGIAIAVCLFFITLALPRVSKADQRTTDFCLKYLGEELQSKPSLPIGIGGYGHLNTLEIVHPIYREQFNSYSTISRSHK